MPVHQISFQIPPQYQLLLHCLSHETPVAKIDQLAKFTPADWGTILKQARQHALTPLLYGKLSPIGAPASIPTNVLQTIRQAALQTASQNALLYHELNTILFALQDASIPTILLKGIHLAEFVYQNIALRPMCDIDVLVRIQDLPRLPQIILNQGYTLSRPYDLEQEIIHMHHLPPFHKPPRINLEIHWTITPPGTPVQIDPLGLFERSQPVFPKGVQTHILASEDLLLHLCLHNCQHEFQSGLKPLCDVADTIEYYQTRLDWQQITQRSIEWKAERYIFLSLYLAQHLLAAPVPEDVLMALQPADFTPQIANWAAARLINFGDYLPEYFVQLSGKRSWFEKTGLILRGIFPTPWAMAQTYGVSQKFTKILPLYFHRLLELSRRGFHVLQSSRQNPENLALRAAREAGLSDWLGNTWTRTKES